MSNLPGYKTISTSQERLDVDAVGLRMRPGPKWVVRLLTVCAIAVGAFVDRNTPIPELRLAWEISALTCFFALGVYFAEVLPIWTKK